MTHLYSRKIPKLVTLRYDQILAIEKKPRGWFSAFVRVKLDELAGIPNHDDTKKLSDMECATNSQTEGVKSER